MCQKSLDTRTVLWDLRDVGIVLVFVLLAYLLVSLFLSEIKHVPFFLIYGLVPLWLIGKYKRIDFHSLGLFFSKADLKRTYLMVIIISVYWLLNFVILEIRNPNRPFLPFILSYSIIRASVLSPLGEEVFFRGFMYPIMRTKRKIVWGVVFNGIIFSLLHFNYFHSGFVKVIIYGMIHGMIYCYLYEKSRTLLPSIVTHSLVNFMALYGRYVGVVYD